MLNNNTLNWINFAKDDLRGAKILHNEGSFNLACFHAQQCFEKSLKAFLIEHEKTIPKTHLLEDLLNECIKINPIFESFREDSIKLDQYYIPTRYPDAIIGSLPEGLPNQEDGKEAIEIAEKIFEYIHNNLGR